MIKSIQAFLNFRVISLSEQDITVGQILIVPVFIFVGYVLLRWIVSIVSRMMVRRDVNADVAQVVRRATMVIGLIIIFFTTLDLLAVPLTTFAFVSGAIAIGIGFGAQNIINNFISGWILMWERPIRINDYIEVGETTGTVEEINTRSTRIRRVDGVHLLVPNSRLLEETVVNWTLIDNLLRSIVRVGVAYGSDVGRTRDLLLQVAMDHPLILNDPACEVIFEDFGDSSLIFDLYFWVQSGGEKSARSIRSEVRFEVDRLFRENGITIAFPQRDIHLDGKLTVHSS